MVRYCQQFPAKLAQSIWNIVFITVQHEHDIILLEKLLGEQILF